MTTTGRKQSFGPRTLAAIERILELRRRGQTHNRIGLAVGLSHHTIAKVLAQYGDPSLTSVADATGRVFPVDAAVVVARALMQWQAGAQAIVKFVSRTVPTEVERKEWLVICHEMEIAQRVLRQHLLNQKASSAA